MIDLSSIQTFTDTQVRDILRLSLVNTALAKEYAINGRQVSRMSGAEIQNLISIYEWRISRAAGGIFFAAQMRDPE